MESTMNSGPNTYGLARALADDLGSKPQYMTLEWDGDEIDSIEFSVDAMDIIERHIKSAIRAALQSSKWRDIKNDPPPDDRPILGYQATLGDREDRMSTCWHFGNGVWIGEGGLSPTHWQLLPAPPSDLAPPANTALPRREATEANS